ncbi:acyltransferase 3 [Ralstonia sp. NT80]|uniref:acyltransferase family protein n=1 Tax=Ralstonia sp. NT80 TaxID=1218247 RepID=UPI00076EEC4C|nr:acyltransferase [Ralstonia sp. NT80]GAQ30197.1 acyltransferase 3 [Ralstonia sp. NT80]
MTPESQKLDSVQCLRGIAAMSVFIFHMRFQFPVGVKDVDEFVWNVVMKGFLGVDIFFVISGFILAWVGVLSRRNGPVSPIEFGIKRAFRVAPAFWASMAVIAYFLGRGATDDHLLKMLAFYPIGNLQAPYYSEILNEVGWTLNYEMAFYAIFCACLVFGRFALAAVSLALAGLVLIAPLAYGYMPSINPNVSVIPFNNMYLRGMTNPLMLEFLIGIGCAWVYAKYRDRVSGGFSLALVAVGAFFLALSYVIGDQKFSLLRAAPPTAVLLVGALFSEHHGRLKVPRFAVWLGDISFALYLTHWTLERLAIKYFPHPIGIAGEWGRILVLTAIGLIVAQFWKRYIEDPTAAWGHALAKTFRFRPQLTGSRAAPVSAD